MEPSKIFNFIAGRQIAGSMLMFCRMLAFCHVLAVCCFLATGLSACGPSGRQSSATTETPGDSPAGTVARSPGTAPGDEAGNWQLLFNHENLAGWTALPGGKWEVRDGIIVGTSPKEEKLHGILLSDKIYSDFKLKVIYKAIRGNSGVYFRVEPVDDPVHVYGLQAEIDPEKDAGGLYDTGDRGWVVQPAPEDVKKWYKPGTWNEMTIQAKGKDVTVHLNGYETAVLKDDPGRTRGHIGLQLHAGMEMHVLFKDILIEAY